MSADGLQTRRNRTAVRDGGLGSVGQQQISAIVLLDTGRGRPKNDFDVALLRSTVEDAGEHVEHAASPLYGSAADLWLLLLILRRMHQETMHTRNWHQNSCMRAGVRRSLHYS